MIRLKYRLVPDSSGSLVTQGLAGRIITQIRELHYTSRIYDDPFGFGVRISKSRPKTVKEYFNPSSDLLRGIVS